MNWRTAMAEVERLNSRKGRKQTGLFSIEGIRLVERAVRAGLPLQTVLISQRVADMPSERETAVLQPLTATSCHLVTIPNEEMMRLTNGRSLGELMGVLPLPTAPTLIELPENPLLLTAVDIIDPGNVGAMVRTAHASGCAALLTVGRSDPFHPKAVRTSMGSLFKMPILAFNSVDGLLAELAEHGIVTVGTAVQGQRPLVQSTFPNSGLALLMGNEYWGLPDSIGERLDINVSIPMAAGIDSFSVNAATAVVLYEINRQRGASTGYIV